MLFQTYCFSFPFNLKRRWLAEEPTCFFCTTKVKGYLGNVLKWTSLNVWKAVSTQRLKKKVIGIYYRLFTCNLQSFNLIIQFFFSELRDIILQLRVINSELRDINLWEK